MAMTNAERQQRYRAKCKESGSHRINTTISTSAHACLKQVAQSQGWTEREALEAILLNTVAEVKPATASNYSDFKQAILSTGTLKSQRGYIKDGYRDRQVRAWFKQLVTEGLIQKEGQGYQLTSVTP